MTRKATTQPFTAFRDNLKYLPAPQRPVSIVAEAFCPRQGLLVGTNNPLKWDDTGVLKGKSRDMDAKDRIVEERRQVIEKQQPEIEGLRLEPAKATKDSSASSKPPSSDIAMLGAPRDAIIDSDLPCGGNILDQTTAQHPSLPGMHQSIGSSNRGFNRQQT